MPSHHVRGDHLSPPQCSGWWLWADGLKLALQQTFEYPDSYACRGRVSYVLGGREGGGGAVMNGSSSLVR